MDELKLVITSTPSAVIIGKVSLEDPEGIVLDPRAVSLQPTKDGVAIRIIPLVGYPKTLQILGGDFRYLVEDSELSKLYVKETSGIDIISSMSSGRVS